MFKFLLLKNSALRFEPAVLGEELVKVHVDARVLEEHVSDDSLVLGVSNGSIDGVDDELVVRGEVASERNSRLDPSVGIRGRNDRLPSAGVLRRVWKQLRGSHWG